MKTIFKKSLFILISLLAISCNNNDDSNNTNNYPTEGLVAYFPFDGDWEDVVTPNTIVTTSDNQPNFDEDRNGNQNSSIYFDGNAQYLNITLASHIISSPNYQTTIAFWLRNDITADLYRTLLAESGIQAIGIQTNSKLPAKVSVNYNYLVEDNEEDITAIGSNTSYPSEVGVWTHLVYTVNSEYLKLYVNGINVKSIQLGEFVDTQFIPILQPYSQFVLGANSKIDEFWRGNIDELFFYDRALTDDEIQSLYLN